MKCEQIAVLVPSDRVRSWVMPLAKVLHEQFRLPVRLFQPATLMLSALPLPSEGVERRLLRAPSYANWISTSETSILDDPCSSACLIVNATERDPLTLPGDLRDITILTPTFQGQFALHALITPLLNGEAPHLGVTITRGGETNLAHGAHLAVPNLLLRALDTVLARAITFVRETADLLITGKQLPAPIPPPPFRPLPAGVGFWSQRVLDTYLPKLGQEIRKRFMRPEDWCIGCRRVRAGIEPPEIDLDPSTFSLIESDRFHFYADPFILRHKGITALFFESYDYRTGVGRIEYVLLSDDGVHTKPRAALMQSYHLSYPFVFSHEGAALMIPETTANRTIELYEAESFPDRWRLRSVLMEDIEAADTTIHFDANTGLWWLFATVTEFGGSSHDTLSLFFSRKIEGPWLPHVANPVKFDPTSSRPAGPLLRLNSRLLRPTQDCTRGYGSALIWCEIEELTPEVFRERPVARQLPSHGYVGLHTYCRAAGFEVIDLKRTDLHRSGVLRLPPTAVSINSAAELPG